MAYNFDLNFLDNFQEFLQQCYSRHVLDYFVYTFQASRLFSFRLTPPKQLNSASHHTSRTTHCILIFDEEKLKLFITLDIWDTDSSIPYKIYLILTIFWIFDQEDKDSRASFTIIIGTAVNDTCHLKFWKTDIQRFEKFD